ncbi:lipoyl(octanoyl) transferase LipB [Spirochaetota bacterium]
MHKSNKLIWKHLGLISYGDALDIQEKLRDRLICDENKMFLLTLEHPRTITMGRTSLKEEVLLSENELEQKNIELHLTSRGGKCTCHAPGQLVVYPILDIKKLGIGVDTLVRTLESSMINYLDGVGIKACRDKRNPGVWVNDSKIGYIGINIHRGITSHGFALNLNTDLSIFSYIIPCGMDGVDSISVHKLKGSSASVKEASGEIAREVSVLLGLELVGSSDIFN